MRRLGSRWGVGCGLCVRGLRGLRGLQGLRGLRVRVRAGVAGVAGVSYIKPKIVLYSSIKKFDESDNLQ